MPHKNNKTMKNTTVTLFVHPQDEIYFYNILKVVDGLQAENAYTFRAADLRVSKGMISNWVWINVEIELYIKFVATFLGNSGKFQ